ncbi:leucine-rich repeat domain-containing protein [Leucobacter komagatae]|uniref:leucine-rich repeat domain-containing protein n=1 Tax=Leucobacter komagatae TaxID=55969 RepID=UPI000698640E|nr:leucine-rich repeat domain-containing protein [Leucobacter komagatae]
MTHSNRSAQRAAMRRRILAAVGSLAVGIAALSTTPAVAAEGAVPDQALRACVNEALRHAPDAPVIEAELANLRTLRCESPDVKDLTGLAGATALTELSVRAGDPYRRCDTAPALDLEPILGLTQLKSLGIECAGLRQLEPLTAFSHLIELNVNGNGISDLTPLAELTELETLHLQANGVNDLTPLSGLKRMQALLLESNDVADLSPLADLTELRFLAAENNQLADLTPLSSLSTLETLLLDGNQITDVEPLRSLLNLQHLTLLGNQVTDISPIEPLKNMQFAELSMQRIELPEARVGDTISFEAMGIAGDALALTPAPNYKLTADGIVLLEPGSIELAWAQPFILGSADTGFAGAAYVTAKPRPPIWKWIGIGSAAAAALGVIGWLRSRATARDRAAVEGAAARSRL